MELSPDISQGAATIGKSSAITALRRLILDLLLADDALIFCSRLSGSGSSLAKVIKIMLTWLLAVLSPASRRLTGTAADIDLTGRSSNSFRYLRKPPATVPTTTSLSDTPVSFAMCLTSANGTVRAAKLRWLVMDTFSRVRGANGLMVLGKDQSRLPSAFFSGISTLLAARKISGVILTSLNA